ncbi:acyl-CoA synthetase [Mycobacterium adipatum]|nr:acyl-CoA synthetase [Mycobacterium adipatum]MBI5738247.1 acyl-CoA synthetase [Mycolicibacterium neoaurum]
MFPGTHAAADPQRPAVIMAGSGDTLTYGDLDTRSAQVAAALHAAGLRRGDAIAILADNTAEVFVIYWAAMRSGLYVTAVNHHLSAPEAGYIVTDSGAQAFFVSGALADLGRQVLDEIPADVARYAFGADIDGYRPYRELLDAVVPPLTDQPRGADMLYSSGTTGRPKGIKPHLLPIQVDEPGDPVLAVLQNAFDIGPDAVYLSPAPIYHAAPLKYCAGMQALGATVILMEKFDAEQTLAAIETHRVTMTQMVPTMFVRLLQLPQDIRSRYDLSSLRTVVHAGAPCPPEVKDAMLDWWGPILVEYYSATEAHGMTMMNSAQWRTKRGSVGRAVLGTIHICDDAGAELPAGEVGTVYFERDAMPFVYHNDAAKTREAQHPHYENWTTVGDLGYLDEDGYLFLTDRKSFMIISGGVNIYPQETENVLTLHPAVFDVAVIGVPDPVMGEQVKAVVALRPGFTAGDDLAADLIDYVRDRVAHYKAPRTVDFVDALPRTPTGKLVKGTLKARYIDTTRSQA